MTQADIIELIKAFAQLLTVAVPVVITLIGSWKFYIAYQDKRATAKERDHQMAIELKAADAARAAANEEREDTQMQKLTDALTLLIQTTAARDARLGSLADIVKINNDNVSAQNKILVELVQSIAQLASGNVAHTAKLDDQKEQLAALQARIGVANQLAEERNEWAKETTKVVDKQAATMTEQASRIQELKEQVAALEKDVRDKLLPLLSTIQESLDAIKQTGLNEGVEIGRIQEKLTIIENDLRAFIETYKAKPPDTPAPAGASAVVETGAASAIAPIAPPPIEPEKPGKAETPKEKKHDG